jgi:hypothetical protein
MRDKQEPYRKQTDSELAYYSGPRLVEHSDGQLFLDTPPGLILPTTFKKLQLVDSIDSFFSKRRQKTIYSIK